MTVLTTNTINTYAGNGVTIVFPFTFPILDTADVVVTLISATGVETVQALTTNYTIPGSDVGLAAGNVTMLVAPATGVTVQIERIVAVTQPTDFLNQGRFFPETHERAFDRLLMLIQRAIGLGMNALRVAPREGPIAALPATDPAGKFVGFDLDGNPALLDGTDEFLRADLVSSASGKGAALVSFIQPYTGSAPLTLQTVLRYTININDFLGCDPGGNGLSDTAFAAAAAIGKTIELTPGATYYLSQRLTLTTGSKFICKGMCTIKLKTGTGGYNNTDLSIKNSEAVFWLNGVDDIAIEGIEFITDGVKEVTIYPIRSVGGFTSKGLKVDRVKVRGLSGLNGGYLSINSCGVGSYKIRDYEVVSCGTAQGLSYWTGFMQITAWEIDNDIIPGVYSEPGYGENIRCTNLLLTGSALTDFTQQTDCINIAGSSSTERKGPIIRGVYADGVGEVCDLFCTGASITGVRAKNIKLGVAKFIHGAQHNYIEVDDIENVGLYAAVFNGSNSAAQDIQFNTCVIHNARGVGQLGGGGGTGGSNTTACAFYGPAGGGTPRYPKNNVCIIHNLQGDAAMNFVMRENTNSDLGLHNRCEVHNFDGVLNDRSSGVLFAGNAHLDYKARQAVHLTQALATLAVTPVSTNIPVQFDTVVSDLDGCAVPASFKARMKYPGRWQVHAQVRATGGLATDRMTVKVTKAGSTFKQTTRAYGTVGEEVTFDCLTTVIVTDVDIGTTAADIAVLAYQTGTNTASILGTAVMTYLEITNVGN